MQKSFVKYFNPRLSSIIPNDLLDYSIKFKAK
jgi:hypothetical protein